MLVLISTAARRYAIRREDVLSMRTVSGEHELAEIGTPDRPALPVDLGQLLGEPAQPAGRRHGLVVPVRRRPIVFLVPRIEAMLERAQVHPIPALLARRGQEPWALGVLELEDDLALVLDLRTIARSLMAQRATLN